MTGEEAAPRLQDVARHAGVSLATASRVLSGSEQRVSPDLSGRVLRAAAELNYVPNAHARALARASTSTVGLIVHDVSDPYFSEIARGVLRAASEHDLLVLICNTYRDPDRELEYIAALRAQRVQAVLLAGSGFAQAHLERRLSKELRGVEAAGSRAIVVGRHAASVDNVLPDNVGGARMMVRHLLDLGHRDIGVIAGPLELTTIEDRLGGIREALAAAGTGLPDDRVAATDFTRDGGYRAVLELRERSPECSAIFALNDPMAIGALAALRDHGVSVPSDVSVVGFDDIPAARDVTPPLTTVRLPMEEMGSRALELALKPAAVRPRRVPMPAGLVERASAGPPVGR